MHKGDFKLPPALGAIVLSKAKKEKFQATQVWLYQLYRKNGPDGAFGAMMETYWRNRILAEHGAAALNEYDSIKYPPDYPSDSHRFTPQEVFLVNKLQEDIGFLELLITDEESKKVIVQIKEEWRTKPLDERCLDYKDEFQLVRRIEKGLLAAMNSAAFGTISGVEVGAETVLWLAMTQKNMDTLRMLVKRINLDAQNKHGESALHFLLFLRHAAGRLNISPEIKEAWLKKDNEILDLLIEHGANVNLATTGDPKATRAKVLSVTPLMHASVFGDVYAVKKLLAAGADMDAVGVPVADLNAKVTALDLAKDEEQDGIVALLEAHAAQLAANKAGSSSSKPM